LKILSNFPSIRANLHYSGYLLEWLEKHHPEFVSLLERMVKRGQIEMIGGGYYEPILTTIPEKDALGQIKLLDQKIEDLFGSKPRGLWMAERAWEPNAPELLARARIKYTILDDSIFQLSGVSEEECFHPYLVESRGSSAIIFPLLKKLRYFIPFEQVSKTISYLRKNCDDGETIAVYGDDGEKFGAWPTTYDQVYKRGWLRSFFESLSSNQDWLTTTLLSDYISMNNVHRRIYLPSSSYPELMEWSIPANPSYRVMNGPRGFWRLFLSKYPESGQLYSRMLSVSKMIHNFRGNKDVKRQALIELWKAQYNDVYWHGIFGGLYFPKFRYIAYHHLIRAQSFVEAALHDENKNWISFGTNRSNGSNFDDSIIVNTRFLGLTVKPLLGGSVTNLDFKPVAVNVTDVLGRRYESYHKDIVNLQKKKLRRNKKEITSIHEFLSVKERGLEDLLVYDRYPKSSFLDYFLHDKTTIDSFKKQEFVELAKFACHPYRWKAISNNDIISLVLSQKSFLKNSDGEASRVSLRKSFLINSHKTNLSVDYDLEFEKSQRSSSEPRFATEINLGSLADMEFERNFGRQPKVLNVRTMEFLYPKIGISLGLDFSDNANVWLLPIKSVSKSESGFESNLQGISVIPNFVLEEKKSKFKVLVSIEKI
jgi:hypothetical protein